MSIITGVIDRRRAKKQSKRQDELEAKNTKLARQQTELQERQVTIEEEPRAEELRRSNSADLRVKVTQPPSKESLGVPIPQSPYVLLRNVGDGEARHVLLSISVPNQKGSVFGMQFSEMAGGEEERFDPDLPPYEHPAFGITVEWDDDGHEERQVREYLRRPQPE